MADVNTTDGKSGRTALHHAVEADDLSITGYLILEVGLYNISSFYPICCGEMCHFFSILAMWCYVTHDQNIQEVSFSSSICMLLSHEFVNCQIDISWQVCTLFGKRYSKYWKLQINVKLSLRTGIVLFLCRHTLCWLKLNWINIKPNIIQL